MCAGKAPTAGGETRQIYMCCNAAVSGSMTRIEILLCWEAANCRQQALIILIVDATCMCFSSQLLIRGLSVCAACICVVLYIYGDVVFECECVTEGCVLVSSVSWCVCFMCSHYSSRVRLARLKVGLSCCLLSGSGIRGFR